MTWLKLFNSVVIYNVQYQLLARKENIKACRYYNLLEETLYDVEVTGAIFYNSFYLNCLS